MKSSPVLPYRVLDHDAVVWLEPGWSAFVNDTHTRELKDGDAFTAWDAQLPFKLERSIRVRTDALRQIHAIGRDSLCELVVSASSAGGLTRDLLFRTTVPPNGAPEIHISLEPRSDRLAGDLMLTTGIYLAEAIAAQVPLAPSMPGSRLWESTERIRLEGGAARLPMYEVAFTQAFPGEKISGAEFHVEMGDPELPFEASLTVYLNSEHPQFIRELRQVGSKAERRLWSAIIRRSLTAAALTDWDAYCQPAEAGTLAQAVQRWAKQIWPNDPLERIGRLPADGFSSFEARIESWMQQFGDATESEENS